MQEDSDRLKTRLLKLLPQAIVWSGVGYRSASTRYATSNDITSGAGSKISGGRWNPRDSFATVYLSCDLETGFKESFAHLSYYGFEAYMALPRTFVAVRLKLHRLLNLTDRKVLKTLKVSRRSLLKQDWRKIQDAGGEALTQIIGSIAHDIGYEGILVPSAAAKSGTNLIYFPEKLLAKSQAEVLNSKLLTQRPE